MNIMVSIFYENANISKLDACDALASFFRLKFDCSKYVNGEGSLNISIRKFFDDNKKFLFIFSFTEEIKPKADNAKSQ